MSDTEPAPKSKILWLGVRRAILMLVSAFDAYFNVDPKTPIVVIVKE